MVYESSHCKRASKHRDGEVKHMMTMRRNVGDVGSGDILNGGAGSTKKRMRVEMKENNSALE